MRCCFLPKLSLFWSSLLPHQRSRPLSISLIGHSPTSVAQGDYSLLLARSEYCLVLPEDGWVALFEDAVLHGCIPVYVSGGPKDLHAPFADILKWWALIWV